MRKRHVSSTDMLLGVGILAGIFLLAGRENIVGDVARAFLKDAKPATPEPPKLWVPPSYIKKAFKNDFKKKED